MAVEPSQVNYSGDGYWCVDGQKLNLNDMSFRLQIMYQDGLNSVMTEQFNVVNDEAKKMQGLTSLLQWARAAKDDQETYKDDQGRGHEFPLPGYDGEKDFKTWCSQFGIAESDVWYKMSGSKWENTWKDNIDNLNAALQNVQTQSQQDMMTYKQTMGYHDNSVSQTTYTQQQYNQSNQKIWQ